MSSATLLRSHASNEICTVIKGLHCALAGVVRRYMVKLGQLYSMQIPEPSLLCPQNVNQKYCGVTVMVRVPAGNGRSRSFL